MISLIKPFNRFEWMIAMRYLRSKRSDGGISSMTWISFIGISLAVFALIATLAVRTGFRTEFVGTILGANAHASIYNSSYVNADGVRNQGVEVIGQTLIDIKKLPLIMVPELSFGSIDSFGKGIAVGSGIARPALVLVVLK